MATLDIKRPFIYSIAGRDTFQKKYPIVARTVGQAIGAAATVTFDFTPETDVTTRYMYDLNNITVICDKATATAFNVAWSISLDGGSNWKEIESYTYASEAGVVVTLNGVLFYSFAGTAATQLRISVTNNDASSQNFNVFLYANEYLCTYE